MDRQPPHDLPSDQHQLWADLCARLHQAGRLANADPELARAYVQTAAQQRAAATLVNTTAVLTVVKGVARQNPAAAEQREAAHTLARISQQLGLGKRAPMAGSADLRAHEQVCGRCQQVHDQRHCGGHSRGGVQCGQLKGHGTQHVGYGNCKFHGGNTPSGVTFAQRELASRTVFKLARDCEPITDPLGWLQRLAGQADQWKEACADQVAELRNLTGLDAEGREQVRALVGLLERLMAQCARIGTDMARLNLDERLVELYAQADALLAAQVHRAVGLGLLELAAGLCPACAARIAPSEPAVAEVMGRHLAVIEAAGAVA